MYKTDETTDPTSCLNKAWTNEMLFVLLARDAAAPVAIRAWIEERIRIGKNQRNDPQILEAVNCIATMTNQKAMIDEERRRNAKKAGS